MPDISADETFELIVRHQTTQELMPFLLGLDKKEIILVRLKTKALYRKMNDWRSNDADKLRRNKEALLFLAGLATYSRQEAMGRTFELPSSFFDTNPKDNRGHSALFIAILRHTRPNWLTDWLIQITRTMGWDALDYLLLRELADEGIVTYDPWLFSQSLSSGFRYNHAPNTPLDGTFGTWLLANLQADKILLERDLPLLFDFDTKADWHRFFGGKNSELITWTTVMVQLAESGHLDRNDLLTRSLLALRRDFRRPLLTWFKEVFAALSPTLAERLARQSELLELLAHPLPLVINFALEQLQDLWTEPTFNPAPLLHYADGLMTRPDLKTGVRALLGTFEKLLKRTPNLIPTLPPTLARLATTALANADATVQARAAKLLLAITRAKKPLLSVGEMGETTAAIAQYAGLLSTEARNLLAPFLPADLAPEPGAGPAAAYVPQTEFVPDISPATAIAPVADWHELLFLTGQVLQQDNPANLERWVDGLLRLRQQFPDDYAQQLQPYLLQALPEEFKGKTAKETAEQLQTHVFGARGNGHPQFVLTLLISWFRTFTSPRLPQILLIPGQQNTPDPLLRVELQRLAAAEARLHPLAEPLPMLSTPSHAPYWVAPSVLVTKLLAYEAAGQLPDSADLTVALARTAFRAGTDAADARLAIVQLQNQPLRDLLLWFLAPGNNSLAAAVTSLPHPPQPVVNSLLRVAEKPFSKPVAKKLDPTPTPLAEAIPWLWAVAARTRRPDADLPELLSLGHYPGLAESWQPGWTFEQKSYSHKLRWNKEITNTWQELHVPTTNEDEQPPSPLLLYSLHARLKRNKRYLFSIAPSLPNLLSMLPNNPAPLHWHILRSACRINSSGSEERTIIQLFLRSILGDGPCFDPPATVLLAVGLVHFSPACRALALEVLLAAVPTGRLRPGALGTALGQLLAGEFGPVQRLTVGLAQARAINPTTDDALHQVLNSLLVELPSSPPRSTTKLLDAYANLRNSQPLPDAVRARLTGWQTVGSLKKNATMLLRDGQPATDA